MGKCDRYTRVLQRNPRPMASLRVILGVIIAINTILKFWFSSLERPCLCVSRYTNF